MPMSAPTLEIAHQAASPGRSVRTTWMYTLGSIVFIMAVLDSMLAVVALESFTATHDVVAGVLLACFAIAVLSQIRYCWFLQAGLGGGLPRSAWTASLLIPAAVVWVLGLFAGTNGMLWMLPLWLAISLMAGLLSKGARLAVLAAGVAAAVLHAVLYAAITVQPYGWAEEPALRMLVIYAACTPLVILSSMWWWGVVVELDRHRLMAGELAVAQERLRFAADLHDIQGHHLQVIALKSELAERLLAVDPEAARSNIHETRLIAKQALEETRALVAGYRETTLENELENAREVLSAAGAPCELVLDPLPSHPSLQKALAMTVREATTNILRHSGATYAAIRLSCAGGEATLTIANNGIANNGLVGTPSNFKTPGTGITGLRERVEALGGTLETTVGPDRFELQVRVPSEGTAV